MSLEQTRHGAAAILTINRPEARNAIDPATAQALDAALNELATDRAVSAVVVTAAGHEAFCAGVDLKMHAAHGVEGVITADGFAGMTKRKFPKPLVAAVNGAALGGGWELVLACDMVVAVHDAWFAFPEVTLGLMPDGGGAIRLPNRIPLAIANEIMLTGASVSAERAMQLGLVNRVVPADDLLSVALELCDAMAKSAPHSIYLTKKLIYDSLSLHEEDAWPLNDQAMADIMETPDYWEGPKAFVEKREPRWLSSG